MWSGSIIELIDARIREILATMPDDGGLGFSEDMDPVQYEHFCAAKLRRVGWDARVTTATGDQGVDIIAEALGKRMVVQCKLYSSPVGNGAVQEVIAGRQFQKANFALVVSNADFTPSARQLAQSAVVGLLHHDQLAELGRRLLLDLLQPQEAGN